MVSAQKRIAMKDLLDSSVINTPRAIGSLAVTAQAADGSSRLKDLYQNGCLKALFPNQPDHLEAVLINTSGGITGGDHLSFNAKAEPQAQLTLTTQACERIYKAQPNSIGRVETSLSIAPEALLNWVPQETLFYDKGGLSRRLTIRMHHSAKLLMVEPVIFGRHAMGETQISGFLRDQVDLWVDEALVYRDVALLSGDITAKLARPAVAAGLGAMANILYRAPDSARLCSAIQTQLNDTSGCSLIAPDLCVLRVLAHDGFALRQIILPILDRLTQNTLPKCWRL